MSEIVAWQVLASDGVGHGLCVTEEAAKASVRLNSMDKDTSKWSIRPLCTLPEVPVGYVNETALRSMSIGKKHFSIPLHQRRTDSVGVALFTYPGKRYPEGYGDQAAKE